jgi:hypothetical protein
MSCNNLINKINLNSTNTPSNSLKQSNLHNLMNSIGGTPNSCSLFNTHLQSQNQNVNIIKSNSFVNSKIPTTVKHNFSDTKPRISTGNVALQTSDPFTANTRNEDAPSNKINLEDIIIGKDKRTTAMIRNIPNKYSLKEVVEEISPYFVGKYDYINLPVDYERKLNLGYAFINFTDPLHIIQFYEAYHGKKWNKYKSDKVN